MTQGNDGLSLRSYLTVLARWKWLVIGLFIIGAAIGVARCMTTTKMYSATAQLFYQQQLDLGNPLSQAYVDATQRQAELESLPSVISSSEITTIAQKNMSDAAAASGYSISVQLQAGVNSNTYSNVVQVSAADSSPQYAQEAANAYAKAFIAWRLDQQQGQVTDAITVIKNRLDAFTTTEQRQTSEYITLQQRLSDLEILQGTLNGGFIIIAPAGLPDTPYTPRWLRTIAVMAAGGLIFGLVLTFLLEQMDTRLRDDESISSALHMAIVGHVPRTTARTAERGVIPTLTEPDGHAAEAYRVLRNNLDFMSIDTDVRSIMMTSALQGEGKSVASCNLAISLALAGRRVALVDGDLRGPRVHAYLGLRNSVGTSSVIARRTELWDALQVVNLTPGRSKAHDRFDGQPTGSPPRGTIHAAGSVRAVEDALADQALSAGKSAGATSGKPRLLVLTSGPLPPNPGELVAADRFSSLIADLSKIVDTVIVDAPALLAVGDAAAMASGVQGLVFVLNTDVVRRPQLQLAERQLSQMSCRRLGLVLVEDKRSSAYRYHGYYQHATDSPTT